MVSSKRPRAEASASRNQQPKKPKVEIVSEEDSGDEYRPGASGASASRRKKKPKVEIVSEDSGDEYRPSDEEDEARDEVISVSSGSYYLEDEYEEGEEFAPVDAPEPVESRNGRNGKEKGKGKARRSRKEEREGEVKVATRAEVLSLATDTPPGGSAKEKLEGVDEAIIARIKKALSLGTHEGTGEAEAKAAMRLASKLMAQHNVNQADVLAMEDEEQKLKRAGQSTVTVRSLTGASVILHAWSMVVAQSVEKFFDCKSYSIHLGHRVDWTFYGLAEQTVAAAYAYEMVYNLIMTWSAQNKEAKGRTQKNNYCYGVADGLYSLALKERKQEQRRAIKAEKRRLDLAAKLEAEARERELARLKKEEEDEKKVKLEDEDDDFAGRWYYDQGFQADFDGDEDIDGMANELDETGHINVKKEEDDDVQWVSGNQLMLFRDNAANIADEYLKKSDVKLRPGPKINGPTFKNGGYANYQQGKADAKKIDVKRKRIKGTGQD
ncbi:hypothetical protein CALCODRAFT_496671 [Calocera cornea HHB12733]|uniref:Uncharacterized protein n=1 Tax=Calocera cornea HHB12733 TaxID=1353952 RepID=A0A165FP81_9BASI|nr:hypothetical protein CALCODRAFT_496671 [Calocera cornea HHB12733]